MGHGYWILLLYQVTRSEHPEHAKSSALLLVPFQHAIDAKWQTWRCHILILAMPLHAIDPVDGARRGAEHIQNSRVDADLHRRLIEQTCNCNEATLRGCGKSSLKNAHLCVQQA